MKVEKFVLKAVKKRELKKYSKEYIEELLKIKFAKKLNTILFNLFSNENFYYINGKKFIYIIPFEFLKKIEKGIDIK